MPGTGVICTAAFFAGNSGLPSFYRRASRGLGGDITVRATWLISAELPAQAFILFPSQSSQKSSHGIMDVSGLQTREPQSRGDFSDSSHSWRRAELDAGPEEPDTSSLHLDLSTSRL